MKNLLLAASSLLMAGIVGAQEVPRFTFNVGGGFTQTVGGTSRRLDSTGYNLGAGAGVNLHPNLSLLLDFNYNGLGVNQATLSTLGFPDGNVRLWSLTLNPVVHINRSGPVSVYFIGGGGLYQRTQEFTQPAIATVTAYDPFFGFGSFGVPVNQVLSSYTVNKPGVNGGMGLNFGTKWSAKFYAEARYHRMFLSGDRHMDFIPVTFGLRW